MKDRTARAIVEDAVAGSALQAGGTIVEGTAGNTGIAIALVANERGYKSIIVVPDEQRIKPLSEQAEFSVPTTVTQGPT